MFNKLLLFLFAFLLITQTANAQIEGLANSKILSFDAETIEQFVVEIEPSFEFETAKRYFDSKGNSDFITQNGDYTAIREAEFGLRISIGLSENTETGVYIPADVNQINWGVKYRLPFESVFDAALISGVNIPMEHNYYAAGKQPTDNTASYGYGLVLSTALSDRIFVDANCIFGNYFAATEENHLIDYSFSVDIGYFISDDFQLVAATGYEKNVFKENPAESSDALTIAAGFTFEPKESYALVFYVPYAIYGKNVTAQTGFELGLALILQ